MPIVLTTNDVVLNPDHAWNDVEGVQYHYPNQYKTKIKPGEPFVYYRGVHRQTGPRGQAEYFGLGRIGAVRPDPATLGSSRPSWFCAIDDYVPFNPPVPAKPDGIFYEQIPQNMWRNGVRDLDPDVFGRIVAAANAAPLTPAAASPQPHGPLEADDLIIPRAKIIGSAGARGAYRRSKRAKEVGDWAEAAALTFIRDTLCAPTIVHRAAQGETPGWDLDYLDAAGQLHRVEVKGTVGGAFTAIDLTAGELKAAQLHGAAYWLYLVAGCLTDHPRIQRVCNPAAQLAAGVWTMKPMLYSVSLS